jgi:hypothetical protein
VRRVIPDGSQGRDGGPVGRLVAARGGAVLPAVAAALGSVALAGTLRTWQWFLPSMVAVVLVVGGAELARRTTVARAAVPLAGLAALGIYLVARYARAVGAVGDLRSDVATVAAALATSSRSRRLRARLLPRSTRAASSALLNRCADALDALDDAAASLRARLTPGRRTT